MTRAVVVRTPGGPEALAIEDVVLADPGPGEARVRHEAIGLNFIDTYHRSGLYPLPYPTGIGSEAAGVVEAIADDVHDIAVGDRVAYAGASPGSYADARLVAAHRLVKLPDAIDFETAAAAMLKGMTVEYAGWPLRIAPQGLPRIRTCRFPASGSSSHGFAARDRNECTMRGRGRGNLFSTIAPRSQFMPRFDRRASHLIHARSTARWKAPS